jgi:tetratricopeptide (TPR) repeat protein
MAYTKLVKNLKTLTLVSICLLLVLVISLTTIPVFSENVNEKAGEVNAVASEEDEKSEEILKILEISKIQIETIFNKWEEEDASIPKTSRDKFKEGMTLGNEAIQLRDQGNFEKANEKAIEAMEKYEDALQIADEELPPDSLEEEGVAQKAIGLENAIDRAYYFAEKIDDLALKVEGEGHSITIIRENIEDAETHLETAKAFLESGEINEAARELAKARGILGRSMGGIHKISKDIKGNKADNFLKQSEKRLSKLEEKIEKSLSNVPSEAKIEVVEALQHARNRILEIKERIESGEVDEAVEDLVEFKNYLKQVNKLINDVKKDHGRINEENSKNEEL